MTPQAILTLLMYINPNINLESRMISNNVELFDSQTTIISCNRVIHDRTPTDQEVDSIVSYFDNRLFIWPVHQNDSDSAQVLKNHGLCSVGSFTAMQLQLNQLPKQKLSDNITVIKIDPQNLDHLKSWAQVIHSSFAFASVNELIDLIEKFYNRTTPNSLHLYLGLYENQATSACMMIKQNHDLVSLHWLATIPEMRRHGIASELIINALRDAQSQSATTAIFLASKITQTMCEHIDVQTIATYDLYSNRLKP